MAGKKRKRVIDDSDEESPVEYNVIFDKEEEEKVVNNSPLSSDSSDDEKDDAVPSKVDLVQRVQPQHKKLTVTHLEIEGFKSYHEREVIGEFDKIFTW